MYHMFDYSCFFEMCIKECSEQIPTLWHKTVQLKVAHLSIYHHHIAILILLSYVTGCLQSYSGTYYPFHPCTIVIKVFINRNLREKLMITPGV